MVAFAVLGLVLGHVALAQNTQIMTPDQRLAMQNATLNLQLAHMATDLETANTKIADLQKQIAAMKPVEKPADEPANNR
jgi:hypothetical protein